MIEKCKIELALMMYNKRSADLQRKQARKAARNKMNRCPKCNRPCSDPNMRFCVKDGTPLTTSDEKRLDSLNFKTTAPLINLTGRNRKPETNSFPAWSSLHIGLTLCLLSGVSIAILNEPNTKKLLRANTIRCNDTVIALLLVIFFVGACMSVTNLKKALISGQ
jgi:uncharacterized protein with PQ loop repeat